MADSRRGQGDTHGNRCGTKPCLQCRARRAWVDQSPSSPSYTRKVTAERKEISREENWSREIMIPCRRHVATQPMCFMGGWYMRLGTGGWTFAEQCRLASVCGGRHRYLFTVRSLTGHSTTSAVTSSSPQKHAEEAPGVGTTNCKSSSLQFSEFPSGFQTRQ